MPYKIQFTNSSGTTTTETTVTWRGAKRIMRKKLTGGEVVRAAAYAWVRKSNAWSHCGEWSWEDAETLK